MLAVAVRFLFGSLIVALMLSIGLAAHPRALAEIVRQPRFYLRALLVFEIGVPLLAIAVALALPLSPLATILILLVAVCPGALLIATKGKAKDETYSTIGLNLLVLSAVLAPIAVPLWVSILDRITPFGLQVSPSAILAKTLSTVLLPVAIGFALRFVLPDRVANGFARIAHYFYLAALVVAIGFALYLGAPVLLQVSPFVILATVLVLAGSAVMGYWAARTAPHERRDEARRVVSVAAALGNPGLVLVVVAASYPGFRAAAFVAAYILLRALVMLPIEYWIKRRSSSSPPTLVPHGA